MNNLLKLCLKPRSCTSNTISNNVDKSSINRFFSQKALDVNTNVIKDVILYKSQNEKFFKAVNLFGIAQFGFWTYLSLTAYQTLKDIPVDETKHDVWWRKINFGDSKWRNSLTIISFCVGKKS